MYKKPTPTQAHQAEPGRVWHANPRRLSTHSYYMRSKAFTHYMLYSWYSMNSIYSVLLWHTFTLGWTVFTFFKIRNPIMLESCLLLRNIITRKWHVFATMSSASPIRQKKKKSITKTIWCFLDFKNYKPRIKFNHRHNSRQYLLICFLNIEKLHIGVTHLYLTITLMYSVIWAREINSVRGFIYLT